MEERASSEISGSTRRSAGHPPGAENVETRLTTLVL